MRKRTWRPDRLRTSEAKAQPLIDAIRRKRKAVERPKPCKKEQVGK